MHTNAYAIAVFSYCMPTGSSLTTNTTLSDFPYSTEVSRAFGDLFLAWKVILGCAFLALICSFLFANLIKVMAKSLVWICLILIIAGGVIVRIRSCVLRTYSFVCSPLLCFAPTPNAITAIRFCDAASLAFV